MTGSFTHTSASNMVDNLSDQIDLGLNLYDDFIRSKQTNLKDLDNPNYYKNLEFVEYLELICRIALRYGR